MVVISRDGVNQPLLQALWNSTKPRINKKSTGLTGIISPRNQWSYGPLIPGRGPLCLVSTTPNMIYFFELASLRRQNLHFSQMPLYASSMEKYVPYTHNEHYTISTSYTIHVYLYTCIYRVLPMQWISWRFIVRSLSEIVILTQAQTWINSDQPCPRLFRILQHPSMLSCFLNKGNNNWLTPVTPL